ncbi:MAG: GGDEF domain-containing protein [Rhodospirillales bacterium]|nr:GGDEF domain-containing protein [Rhodospirillales bacterium]
MNIDKLLMNTPAVGVTVVGMVSVLFIAVFDYLTGYEINFFIFYAIPIGFMTWYRTWKAGLLFTVICALIWFFVDHYSGRQYSHLLVPYWNGLVRISFFSFVVYALTNIKDKLILEELNADFDSLTSLLNGRGFRERAATLFLLIRREKNPYSIAFVDLDDFKKVNDSYGHAEGDKVLRSVAKIMKNSLRASDLACRLGGDEFVIFLPDTGLDQAKIVMEGLKEKLEAMVTDNHWPVGFSVGTCGFNSTETNIEDAIAEADSLMYEAKKSKKGEMFYKDLTGLKP